MFFDFLGNVRSKKSFFQWKSVQNRSIAFFYVFWAIFLRGRFFVIFARCGAYRFWILGRKRDFPIFTSWVTCLIEKRGWGVKNQLFFEKSENSENFQFLTYSSFHSPSTHKATKALKWTKTVSPTFTEILPSHSDISISDFLVWVY